MNNKRVKGTIITIDNSSVNDFFKDRASKYNQNNPLKAVLYQDNNPQIAIDRDLKEKKKLLPLLNLIKSTKVLDIGCGIGRWAKTMAPLVNKYHGTDLMPQFIDIAKEECKEFSNVTFQSISAQEITDTSIDGKFNLIFISGLLMYLNDNEIRNLFNVLNSYMENYCQILIREPIGIEERLTLNKVWSEELQCEYSAVYRTKFELASIIESSLTNLELVNSDFLFDDKLNNRVETKQYYFLYERS